MKDSGTTSVALQGYYSKPFTIAGADPSKKKLDSDHPLPAAMYAAAKVGVINNIFVKKVPRQHKRSFKGASWKPWMGKMYFSNLATHGKASFLKMPYKVGAGIEEVKFAYKAVFVKLSQCVTPKKAYQTCCDDTTKQGLLYRQNAFKYMQKQSKTGIKKMARCEKAFAKVQKSAMPDQCQSHFGLKFVSKSIKQNGGSAQEAYKWGPPGGASIAGDSDKLGQCASPQCWNHEFPPVDCVMKKASELTEVCLAETKTNGVWKKLTTPARQRCWYPQTDKHRPKPFDPQGPADWTGLQDGGKGGVPRVFEDGQGIGLNGDGGKWDVLWNCALEVPKLKSHVKKWQLRFDLDRCSGSEFYLNQGIFLELENLLA
jgi:hypothetical protein